MIPSKCIVSIIQATNVLVIFRYNSISSSDLGDIPVAEI